jgi:transposase
MVVVDGQGVPLGVRIVEANPAEVTLVSYTLSAVGVPRGGRGRPRQNPRRLIADKGYDCDGLRHDLEARGIELICPHRRGRRRAPLQDGRALRRYRHRWKIERTFAWFGNYRRLVVRYEYNPTVYEAFFHVAALLITLRFLAQ